MMGGADAHSAGPSSREGCGREFNWSPARPYQPSLRETKRPPGFSAIVSWLESTDDFSSQEAVRAAWEALEGLSQEDRRYAFANAVACMFLKGQQQPILAQSLVSNRNLQTALGFDGHPGFARVASVLCDASQVDTSTSLAASLLLGRGWESVGSSQETLKNTVANLLVAILGGPGNTAFPMFFPKLFN